MSDELIDTPDLDVARIVYDKLVDGTVYVEDICWSDVLNIIKYCIHKHAESANMSFRNASLWFKYMSMIYILHKSIRAERTGNWALHINPSRTCLTTWQPLVATCTPNLPGCIWNRWLLWRKNTQMSIHASMMGCTCFEEAIACGQVCLGSDHRVCYDEKHEHQRLANTRARDDGATTPVVAAVNVSTCSSKPGNVGTHWG